MGTEGVGNGTGRVIAGRYRLEARLGRGGMGIVWRANDELLGRRVAVKELTQDDSLPDEEARGRRDRTLREARAVAQLSHPHVIVVHDVVEEDERPYIVMELIGGGSLADRIAEHGPLAPDEAARIGIALLGALRAAHAAGVLHRDIKPANVLLEGGGEGEGAGRREGDDERVVLTDFGIAQVAGATTLTETGSFVGSPEYTAPERMSGARTGPESDLWSLGALLCTVLSGESPFRRDSLGGILHAVVFADIRTPPQAAPLLPVVRGLLERDPDRRLGAAEAERMLRAFRDTGRTPPAVSSGYTPTQADLPRQRSDAAGQEADGRDADGRDAAGRERSTRGVLVAALLVAAMAGAGVSAAALLVNRDGDGGRASTSSAPQSPTGGTTSGSGSGPGSGSTSSTAATASGADPTPSASASRRSPSPASDDHSTAVTAPSAPSGYRVADDPAGFALAVPEDFTRTPQGERVFYMSPGQVFRLGIKVTAASPDGPLAVMEDAAAKGPDTNPGYHDGRVTETEHGGHPAALWEFTWNGFSAAEGPRHTYDLCWEEGGRLYDVWVSAPVGKVREAREYFDVAVDTFVTG
ncbi:serine/threonine protein kinase [Streptomyces sp. NBC_01275]|uniref:serine/threonine-protein kinase n=1 Tax=Streptomyces sp. NBC_01275 TaxID=2903807 RepID=UPI00224EEBFB|nr:serine/threonine-protein kinase [Streptomyces sp. NBC_01275]MCX4764425.1 serine/threonine protein kinase [Streptomyces sp. NBC_01275]